MSTPVMSQVITANDKAEILALIHGRQTSPHGKHAIHLLSRDLTIAMSGDSAVCRGVVRIAATEDLGRPAEFWMRETTCLERRPDGWRIVREQTSAPFSMGGALGDAPIAGSRLRVDWAPRGTVFQAGC
jgi:ketosteroid isomerase-like protein